MTYLIKEGNRTKIRLILHILTRGPQ